MYSHFLNWLPKLRLKIVLLTLLPVLFFASCTLKKDMPLNEQKEKENKVKAVISFEPSPAYSEKAVSVKVSLSFEAKKIILKLEKAEDFLRNGYVMKKANSNTFVGSFIAPYPGTYPVKLIIVDSKGTTTTITPKGSPLKVIGKMPPKSTPEEVIKEYLKDYLERLPSNYISIKIYEIEAIGTTKNGKIYRVSFIGEKYRTERIKEEKTMYFLVKEEHGGWYVEFLGENPPATY